MDGSNPENPHANGNRELEKGSAYSVEARRGSPAVVDQYFKDVSTLCRTIIEPILPEQHADRSKEQLVAAMLDEVKDAMNDSQTIFVTMVDPKDGHLAGFTYAHPAVIDTRSRVGMAEFNAMGVSLEEYERRQQRTAEIGWTIIAQEDRAKGGWTKMMETLDDEIRATGAYDEISHVARDDEGYSQKVAHRYKNDITAMYASEEDLGPQTGFRIRLRKDL